MLHVFCVFVCACTCACPMRKRGKEREADGDWGVGGGLTALSVMAVYICAHTQCVCIIETGWQVRAVSGWWYSGSC